MDVWDREAIDLAGPGFIEFTDDATVQLGFIAVHGWMDCRTVNHDGRARIEFSWEGDDEGDQVSGRGWAMLNDDRTLEGHLSIHMGDDSRFRAIPWTEADEREAE